MFLSSGVAASAGSAAAVLVPSGVFGGGTAQMQQKDLLLDEILRQFEGAVHQLQERPSGESARRIGSALRLLASWGRERKIDDKVRRGLRDAVRREGRGAMLARPFDAVEELKLRGHKIPPGAVGRATTADRARVLDELLANGVTRSWEALAQKFEDGSARLDRRIGLVRLQDDDDEEEDRCEGMRYFELLLEANVYFFCIFMGALLWEGCAIVSLELLGWKSYMWWNGC